MAIELKEPSLIRQIEQLASETTQSVETVLEMAVRTYLEELERGAIRRETQAFWTMHDELLQTYRGQHVALYHGSVVDHDDDVSRLEKRVREKFRSLPVLIAPVNPGPRRDLRWLGGKLSNVESIS